MKEKVLITSALIYANGPAHFGHMAGCYLPADCYARFERLRGKDVLYVGGSDEHGVAITLAAEKAGRSPQEHVDLYHAVNKTLYDQMNFQFDHYSRTTWKGHIQPSQEFFKDLLEEGKIEPQVCGQLYSEQEQRFLADRYVLGTCPKCGYEHARGDECTQCGASYEATDLINPRSAVTQAPLSLKKTKHWFLRLDLFKEDLLAWLDQKKWRSNVVNFVKNYIKDLRPRAITRDASWGIPVPVEGGEGKVLYVWFDAPIGYISATMEWAQQQGKPEAWKDYWCDEKTKLVQFIGKDNIPFHSVIFPAMVMGQKRFLKLVDELPANEFLHLEGRQFSKSEGWYVDLERCLQQYSADQIRYTLAANAPESQDSEFTWKDFQSKCNSDLLGKYGNLANRILVFAFKQCEGQVPSMKVKEKEDLEFLEKVREIANEAEEAYAGFRLRKASQLIMELAQAGNVYFNAKQPWKDAKQEETRPRMETTVSCCLECLKVLALISCPVIPEASQKLWQFLGKEEELEKQVWNEVLQEGLKEGTALAKPEILFRRIEDEEIEKERERLLQLSEESQKKKEALSSVKT